MEFANKLSLAKITKRSNVVLNPKKHQSLNASDTADRSTLHGILATKAEGWQDVI